MRRSLLGLFLLALSQAVWSSVNIEHWQTAQGSRVFFVHAGSLPIADIVVAFDAGSARDGKQAGLAALTSGLLEEGGGQWNADQIAERFESVGAQFGTSISSDMASVTLRTLTDKPLFDKAIDTMHAILAKPAFKEADFQREKKRTLAGLKQREESPGDLADIAFSKALYGDHPYAHPDSGLIETVTPLKASDLRSFYRQYYVAANAVVVIVGNLNKAQAEQTVAALLKDLPAGQKAAPLPDVRMPAKASLQQMAFPSTQTHVLVGIPGVDRKDPDYFSLFVGNHILGGSGLVSKLFEEIREKRGLAYSAYSAFRPMLKKGPFVLGLQTRNDQTAEALKVLNQTLAEFITKGPTEAELTAAKKNITGGFPMRFDTNRKLASYVAMIGFYDLPLDYLDTFTQKIEAVTVAAVTEAFKRHVDLNLLQTVTVGGDAQAKSGK
jgi:zinc protease